MDADPELWKKLELGDRVRVYQFLSFEGYLHDDTAALYRWLVETKHVLTVMRLEYMDGQTYPWSGRIYTTDGRSDEDGFHYLMLDHDGLKRVD